MRLGVPVGLLAILLAPLLAAGQARAAVPAFDSLYQFESAFLGNLRPGDAGTFSVFFANTGTQTWTLGSATQVNLAACRDDKVTCGVAPEEAAWNPGSWLSSTAYATHTKTSVAPGDFSAFSYGIKVPANAALGTYRFNGDLVVAATSAKLHPEGYFQDATVTSTAPSVTAPTDVQIQVGNLDSGPKDDDVRIFFTAPASNPLLTYDIQRAPGPCPIANDSSFWTTIQSLTLVGGVFGAFNDLDRPAGFACYQVRVPAGGGAYVYSKQAQSTVFGPSDLSAPTSQSAVLTNAGGFANTLDAGDQFVITFSRAMTISSTARIRVTDADCGAPASQSSGPASCTSPVTQTISDVICGTNATCVLSFDALTLTVTMTASPLDVSSGSSPGTQFPAVFVDSSGITATGGTAWNITTSADRVIGPLGQ